MMPSQYTVDCMAALCFEQKNISDFINTECDRIDSTIKKITEVKTYLIEYRTALITAAVTGKIEVRNFQPRNESLRGKPEEAGEAPA